MSSVKLFYGGLWDGLPTEQHQIKIASTGLGFTDRKAAEEFASPELLFWLSKIATHPDCFYVHNVAMGGSHNFGPNRWGDGFREEVLKRDVPTFESAMAYRQHRSKEAIFGRVKLAQLRQPDGYVDLVTEYFGTDAVARELPRGQIADEEIQALSKHGYFPVSMGSLVPHDVCVICNHVAPKPVDRCSSIAEGGSCPLFGCKTGMLNVAADGRMNYVDNPYNRFYDISKVKVGADQVANAVLLPIGDFHHKMAELQSKVAAIMTPEVINEFELNSAERTALGLAYYWADLETKRAAASDDDLGYVSHVSNRTVDLRDLRSESPLRRDAVISNLARRGELPDFTSFAKAAGCTEGVIKEASYQLPNLYFRLIQTGRLLSVIKHAAFSGISSKLPLGTFATPVPHGIDLASTTRRSLQLLADGAELRERKVASFAEFVPPVVEQYAAMKLAFFVKRDRVDTAALYAVARRDMFEIL